MFFPLGVKDMYTYRHAANKIFYPVAYTRKRNHQFYYLYTGFSLFPNPCVKDAAFQVFLSLKPKCQNAGFVSRLANQGLEEKGNCSLNSIFQMQSLYGHVTSYICYSPIKKNIGRWCLYLVFIDKGDIPVVKLIPPITPMLHENTQS